MQVIIYGPKRIGGKNVARRINEETGCTSFVVDEIFPSKDFSVSKDTLLICMGDTKITPKEMHKIFADMPCKNDDVVSSFECEMICDASKRIKSFADKYKCKYFDTSGSTKKTLDEIVEYVKATIMPK